MAVFGVDIFDADGANETYQGIMELYNSGADREEIEKRYPLRAFDEDNDFDNELYITVCALAYWEIGLLHERHLAFVKSILEKGVSVREWTKDDKRLGEQRKSVLEKYWDKISHPPKRIKKRKRFEKIFDVDDVISIRILDGSYRAFICVDTDKYFRGGCYFLAPTSYCSADPPTVEKILESEMFVCAINNGDDAEKILSESPGIEHLWQWMRSEKKVLYRLIGVYLAKAEIKKSRMSFAVIGRVSLYAWVRKFGITTILDHHHPEEQYFVDGFRRREAVAVPLRVLVNTNLNKF